MSTVQETLARRFAENRKGSRFGADEQWAATDMELPDDTTGAYVTPKGVTYTAPSNAYLGPKTYPKLPMSNLTKVAIGAGVLAVLGGGYYYYTTTQKKKTGET